MNNARNVWPWGRWAALLFASAIAGALSGILGRSHGMARGAILGVSLSMGHVLAAVLGRRRLDEGASPDWKVTGVAAGVALAIAVAGLGLSELATWPHRSWQGDRLSMIGICAIYSLGLHTAWHVRRRGRPRDMLKHWFGAMLTAFVAGVARVISGTQSSQDEQWLWTSPALLLIGAAFTGLPFTVLWLVVSHALDPAASVRRWQRIREKHERS